MGKERENRILWVFVLVMAISSMIEAGVELLTYSRSTQEVTQARGEIRADREAADVIEDCTRESAACRRLCEQRAEECIFGTAAMRSHRARLAEMGED